MKLSWNKSGADDIDDAMGYNIYRFTERVRYEDVLDEFGNKIWDDETDDWLKNEIIERDTLRINPYVIDVEDESYIDRAVTPGETYHYYYKLQGTNLKEYGISNTVSAVPNERLKGDVNLDGNVDIDDVNNTISHIKGETPDDFIESAADVNEDGVVDWADVVIIADIAGVTVGISDAERLNNKELKRSSCGRRPYEELVVRRSGMNLWGITSV